MENTRVWQVLKKRLRREPNPNIVECLIGEQWEYDLEDGAATEDELIKKYRKLEKIVLEEKQKRKRGERVLKRELSPDRRALILAKILALHVASSDLVQNFRKTYLPDGLLKPGQVEMWIKRQAEADGPPSYWVEFPVSDISTIPNKWPAGTRRSRKSLEYLDVRQLKSQSIHHTIYLLLEQCDLNIRSSESQFIFVAAGGVLDHLRQISELLALRYGWTRAQATNFVLTGEVPVLSPCTITIHTHIPQNIPQNILTRITLTIDPEMHPEQVKHIYSKIRKEFRCGRQRYRPLTERTINLVEFVLDHPDLSWQERLTAWNQAHPTERYTSPQSMANTYYRALSKLLL